MLDRRQRGYKLGRGGEHIMEDGELTSSFFSQLKEIIKLVYQKTVKNPSFKHYFSNLISFLKFNTNELHCKQGTYSKQGFY